MVRNRIQKIVGAWSVEVHVCVPRFYVLHQLWDSLIQKTAEPPSEWERCFDAESTVRLDGTDEALAWLL